MKIFCFFATPAPSPRSIAKRSCGFGKGSRNAARGRKHLGDFAGLRRRLFHSCFVPTLESAGEQRISLPDLPGELAAAPGQAHRVTYMPLAPSPAASGTDRRSSGICGTRCGEDSRPYRQASARARPGVSRRPFGQEQYLFSQLRSVAGGAYRGDFFFGAWSYLKRASSRRKISRTKKSKSPDRSKTIRSMVWRSLSKTPSRSKL